MAGAVIVAPWRPGPRSATSGWCSSMSYAITPALARSESAERTRIRHLPWNGGGGPPEAMATSRSPIAERKPAMRAHAECRPLGHPVGYITPLVYGW
jgi:hypothetical protein